MSIKYKRVLLKLSGEVLAGEQEFGFDSNVLSSIANDIKEIHDADIQVGIVIGGGNIFRGLSGTALGVDRTAGDNIGMLATVMNSLMIKAALKSVGLEAIVMSAFQAEKIADYFVCDKAIEHLNEGKIVIVAGGTGNPFFTTDTAAALRCAELDCDVLMKATKVDGIYNKDPMKYDDAVKIDTLTHQEALEKGLKVMDSTAFSLCMDNDIPIVVFELMKPGNIMKAISGNSVCSTVTKG